MDIIDFYYFSGTGNTILILEKMVETFKKRNKEVNLFKIENSDPLQIDLSHCIGLAFPVALEGTYPFVWKFMDLLPQTNLSTQIFMVDTLAMFSGGIVGKLKKILQKKGYNTIGAKEIRMPSNFRAKERNTNKDSKINAGLKNAETYANNLLNLTTYWGRIPILGDLMALFSRTKRPWEFMRKHFQMQTDTEKCNKCGLCIKICPIGNITMKEYPKFSDKCALCLRCINFCPQEAIFVKNKKFGKYKSVNVSKILEEF